MGHDYSHRSFCDRPVKLIYSQNGEKNNASRHQFQISGETMTLKGIRVVEIGQVISAPYAGMIFADLGAEVIKVEKPGNGDESRAMGPAFLEGSSMAFQELNRGKQSVVIGGFKSEVQPRYDASVASSRRLRGVF